MIIIPLPSSAMAKRVHFDNRIHIREIYRYDSEESNSEESTASEKSVDTSSSDENDDNRVETRHVSVLDRSFNHDYDDILPYIPDALIGPSEIPPELFNQSPQHPSPATVTDMLYSTSSRIPSSLFEISPSLDDSFDSTSSEHRWSGNQIETTTTDLPPESPMRRRSATVDLLEDALSVLFESSPEPKLASSWDTSTSRSFEIRQRNKFLEDQRRNSWP